jgi:hypothetical protein
LPRELIHVTRSASRLTGQTRIEPGYPKDYTPEQMRMWADDMARLNRTSPAELSRLQALAPDQRSPEEQRMLVVHDAYLTDNTHAIKGSLRPDGKVELDSGRHRAAYMVERGVDPVPVWVWAREQRQLDDLRAQCDAERRRAPEAVRAPLPEQSRGRDRGRDGDNETGGDRVRA